MIRARSAPAAASDRPGRTIILLAVLAAVMLLFARQGRPA